MKKIRDYENVDIFKYADNHYQITKEIRTITFFSGIGFQEKGIKDVFPNTKSYKTCEWAVPSIIGYDAIWNGKQDKSLYTEDKEMLVNKLLKLGISLDYDKPADKKQINRMSVDKLNQINQAIERCHNLVNIMNVKGEDLEIVDTEKYEYLFFYSFPCQDLSLAGLGRGFSSSQSNNENQSNEGEGTRSGLVWEIIRILNECKNKPNILICENVPQLHSKDNMDDFNRLQLELHKMGYNNYWNDMNAVDYTQIPQNRNRTFMVSIYDPNNDYIYSFPFKTKLKTKLKDMLEENVDEKYYLSFKDVERISSWNAQQDPLKDIDKPKEYVQCLTARGAGEEHSGMVLINEDVYMGTYQYAKSDNFMQGRDRFRQDKVVADCLQTSQKEGVVIKVGNYGNGHHAKDISSAEGVMPTITTGNHGLGQAIAIKEKKNEN